MGFAYQNMQTPKTFGCHINEGELSFDVWITREETDIEYENRMADLAEKKAKEKLAKEKKEEQEKADYLRLKKKYGDKV